MRGAHLLANLHPKFAPAVRYLVEEAEAMGIPVTITSGYRSVEEQRRVCADLKERERKGHGRFPCATPGLSAHQYGLAVDMMGGNGFASREHAALAELGEAMGFARVRGDPPHFEHPAWRAIYPQVKRALGL